MICGRRTCDKAAPSGSEIKIKNKKWNTNLMEEKCFRKTFFFFKRWCRLFNKPARFVSVHAPTSSSHNCGPRPAHRTRRQQHPLQVVKKAYSWIKNENTHTQWPIKILYSDPPPLPSGLAVISKSKTLHHLAILTRICTMKTGSQSTPSTKKVIILNERLKFHRCILIWKGTRWCQKSFIVS